MCGFTITNKKIENVSYVDHFTRMRGPDGTHLTEIEGITVIHHLLWITGKRTAQPFIDADTICVFNGEIYNYKEFGDYETDGECIIPLYQEYGDDFIKFLDGEYAIVIINLKTQALHFFRDIFATKPCYFAYDQSGFAVSSYVSSLKRLGFKNWGVPDRCPHNFNLEQYKDSYDDWIAAFERAVEKRVCTKPMFIGLSSGYDSGAIDCALQKSNVKYTAVTVGQEFLEERNSIKVPLPDDLSTIDFSYVDQDFNYPITKDLSSYGHAVLFKTARDMGFKVCLSGQGSDEIMWDYDRTRFATDDQTFGEHFFEKRQQWYLGREERIAGAHGIESRYPFLDRAVVQEYLALTPEMKNKYYKAPIREYFTRNNYPFDEDVKLGFAMGLKDGHVPEQKIPEWRKDIERLD